MFASIEYLLAGLPIVSTQSLGGRNEFFNSYNSVIAEANPESIRNAVLGITSRNLDRQKIRRDAIAKQSEIVNKFCHFVNEIVKEHSGSYDIIEHWNDIFCNKLLCWYPVEEFLDNCRIVV